MGRLIGYMANRADRLHDALHQEREIISMPASPDPAGWGIGFYQGGEVLHKKRPLFQGETLDWGQIAKDVRSDCVVIHVRHATVGDFRAHNTHPFRMRSWLFAHHGTISRFENVRIRMLDDLPDFIRRNIRGDTDSEHFFHLILSFLHDSGQLTRPDVNDTDVLNALRSAVRLVDRLGKEVGAEPAALNCILTNGRNLYALKRGRPMAWVERTGIQEPVQEPKTPVRPSPSALRYVSVVTNGDTVPAGYRPVEDGTVLTVDRDLNVQLHPL